MRAEIDANLKLCKRKRRLKQCFRTAQQSFKSVALQHVQVFRTFLLIVATLKLRAPVFALEYVYSICSQNVSVKVGAY